MKIKTMRLLVFVILVGLGGFPEAGLAQPSSGPFPLTGTVTQKAGMSASGAVVAKSAEKTSVKPPAFVYPAVESPRFKVSLAEKIWWYVPNRFMDFVDIFRFRVRVGPGLALGVRFTDYGSFYFGRYNSIYMGLPGPRNSYLYRLPAGFESLNGIVLGGVDATDDTPYGPAYGPSEVDIGFQFLVIGAEAGIDPREIGDFLGGFFMRDMERDDYPRRRGGEPKVTSGVSRSSAVGMFRLNEKPVKFDGLDERLDYLHTNVQMRVSEPVRSVDEYFAVSEAERVDVPDSRMRLGVYAEGIQGKSFTLSFQPDIDLDVAVPNMEKRMHIFVQSGQSDDLPGRTPSETESDGLTVGARRYFKKYDISTDAGVRWSWPPRAYGRVQWYPQYDIEQWSVRPQLRAFVDTKEKLGGLSSLYIDRWLGKGREYYVGTISSAKYTTEKEETSWQQSLKVGRVREVLTDRSNAGRFERRDVASGGDIQFGVFGTDQWIDTYRLTVGVRRPLYQKWIFWDVEPGVEWIEENDFDLGFRITAGIDMLFWGPSGK